MKEAVFLYIYKIYIYKKRNKDIEKNMEKIVNLQKRAKLFSKIKYKKTKKKKKKKEKVENKEK